MGETTYIVTIEHKERGIGFSARTALQNHQKQDSSPIKKVTFAKQSTNKKSELSVVLDDQATVDYLTNCIENSGRMPSQKDSYQIKSIKLAEKEIDNTELNETKTKLANKAKAIRTLQEENEELRAQLSDIKREEIKEPLQGLLLYFDNLDYKADNVLDNSVDSGFLRRVLRGGLENKLVDYVNHVLGQQLDEVEVEEILQYDLNETNSEFEKAKEEHDKAQEELNFLEKLKDGSSEVPTTIVPSLIENIEAKDHQRTINRYKKLEEEDNKKKELVTKIKRFKSKFEKFSEQIGILLEASEELPVIFYNQKESLEIYFPFIRNSTKTGIINNLGNDLSFSSITLEPLDHKFVAYKTQLEIDPENNTQSLDERLNFYISSMMEDVPFTLQVAGYNAIKPTILIS